MYVIVVLICNASLELFFFSVFSVLILSCLFSLFLLAILPDRNDWLIDWLHWRRQLWGIGACAPSTSNCLIFLLNSEPHKLWHWTIWCLPRKNILAYSFVTVYCTNFIMCVSPLNYFQLVSCPPGTKSWRRHLIEMKPIFRHIIYMITWYAAEWDVQVALKVLIARVGHIESGVRHSYRAHLPTCIHVRKNVVS